MLSNTLTSRIKLSTDVVISSYLSSALCISIFRYIFFYMTFYIESAVSMSLSCREKNVFGHLYPFVMKVICISIFVQARTLTHDEIEGTSHFLIKYAFKCISACSNF